MLPRRLSSTLERPVPSAGREQFQAQTARAFTEVGRLVQHPGTRIGAGVLAFALVTAVTYPIARYRMFTGFMDYDDEGYMLFALKSFVDSGWHYDGFNGYGPFYYEFWGTIYSLFGLPVDNNSGRAVVMVAWLATSLILGLATWRVTHSMVLGLASQFAVFWTLFSLIAEPMHPGSIIVVALVVILALACFVRGRSSPLAMGLLGATVLALILVKVNVGIFALAAVVLVCSLSYPALARHRWLRALIEIGFVTAPIVLMRSRLDATVARDYALHVSATALAVVIALRVHADGGRDSRELRWLIGGGLIVALAVPAVVLVSGTDPAALFEGLVKYPLVFGAAVFRLAWLPKASYLLDLVSVTGALGYWYLARNRRSRPGPALTWFAAVLSIAVGLFLAFPMVWSMAMATEYTTQYLPLFIRWSLLSAVWVALIQPPGRPDPDTRFARLLLPPLAVLQSLHAFPSAGGQMWWSTFLLIPVGALCIANGIRWIAFGLGPQQVPSSPLAIRAIAPAMALAVLVSNAGLQLRQEIDHARTEYNSQVSLRLPGAEEIHVSPQKAANLRATVAAINMNCRSLVILPGLYSFYLWARPTLRTGYWTPKLPLLADAAHQQEMIESIRSIDDLCLVKYPPLMRSWRQIRVDYPGPVVRYLQQGFVQIGQFGDYQLLKRQAGDGRP